MSSIGGKKILLVVSGGISAYKCLELIRRLRDRDGEVHCVLTAAGSELVTPLSLAAISGQPVHRDLFSLTDETAIGHIQLSRAADLVVVAPATANIIAKMAAGIADDLATTLLLATDKRILIAPAMNVRMWDHPATQANLVRLGDRGVLRVGPNAGAMACNEYGLGRMAEPEEILAAIDNALTGDRALAGLRALVTSGPTFETIDPVRFIGNRSSGKQGHAIARALAARGADVTLVSGPVALADPPGIRTLHIETAQEMLAACESSLPVDIAICAAAVADWRIADPATEKIKKGEAPRFTLVENPDILRTLSTRSENRPRLVLGFAAETENVVANAVAKRTSKGCDWIVANDVSPRTGTFGGDVNTVHLITKTGVEDWPTLDKTAVARRLTDQIAEFLTRSIHA